MLSLGMPERIEPHGLESLHADKDPGFGLGLQDVESRLHLPDELLSLRLVLFYLPLLILYEHQYPLRVGCLEVLDAALDDVRNQAFLMQSADRLVDRGFPVPC